MGIPVKWFDETTWSVAGITATPANALAAPGSFCGFSLHNPNMDAVYLHIYDALAANVTVGTTAPLRTFEIPASGQREETSPPMAQSPCATAVSYAVTTTLAGSTTPGTALSGKIFFKKTGY